MSVKKTSKEKVVKQKFSMQLMWKQRYLLLMSLPFVVWLIVFKYIPLWGWTMAFQDVKPKTMTLPIWQRPFVGFDNFVKAFQDRIFGQTLLNTIGLSILGIAIGTIMAIVFALMLNEIRFVKFKKITQTISYLPHFVSWVVIASIAKMVLNDGGMLDTVLNTKLGLMSTNSPLFWFTVVLINTWKEVGWDAIVYLSAMAGIDHGLYEAAKVDGANRLQRIWHITLPGIKPTIVVLLIMGIGGALNVGMERQMLLSNGIVQDHAMVLSWFAYVRGIGNSNYGLGTAIGMFQSLVGITLLFVANKVAGLLGESKLV
ncbi:MAG: ABC transporter permease subunit [Lachnospiraceae bacterium]|nr:ABC transporter permease subunit [Lachnospiraceae bacterium]